MMELPANAIENPRDPESLWMVSIPRYRFAFWYFSSEKAAREFAATQRNAEVEPPVAPEDRLNKWSESNG